MSDIMIKISSDESYNLIMEYEDILLSARNKAYKIFDEMSNEVEQLQSSIANRSIQKSLGGLHYEQVLKNLVDVTRLKYNKRVGFGTFYKIYMSGKNGENPPWEISRYIGRYERNGIFNGPTEVYFLNISIIKEFDCALLFIKSIKEELDTNKSVTVDANKYRLVLKFVDKLREDTK